MMMMMTISGSAGLMYWGDAKLNRVEVAYLNGTGRTVLHTESTDDVHYFAFVLRNGNIYYTDWAYAYVCLLIFPLAKP